MSSKLDSLKQTYLSDVDKYAAKSRFGYFSIPPPCSAGDTLFQQKTVVKDQNGRVKTSARNIFSGPGASGVLSKSYFSYVSSVSKGDEYKDLGKVERINNMQENKKLNDRQTYKPVSLQKTMQQIYYGRIRASYEYIPHKTNKPTQVHKDADGRVPVSPRNIYSNTSVRIDTERYSQVDYVANPYDYAKLLTKKNHKIQLSKRGQQPFKVGSPIKQLFSSNKQQFGQSTKAMKRVIRNSQIGKKNQGQIEETFKPVCIMSGGQFSYPEYMPEGKKTTPPPQVLSKNDREAFKLIKISSSTKPSPSISYSRLNILKSMR